MALPALLTMGLGGSPFSSAKLLEGLTTVGSGTKFRREDIGRSSSCSKWWDRAACTAAMRARDSVVDCCKYELGVPVFLT